MRVRTGLWLILLAFCCLSLAACLDTKRKVGLTYDATKDEFHVLRLYYHIRAESEGDAAYLAALYQNRDHIIPYDVIALFDESAALRLPDGSYRQFSLGKPAGQTPPATTLPGVDLNKVKIEPGVFLESPEHTLCYFHQVTFPGSMVDRLLGQGNETVRTLLADQVSQEQNRRATGGPTASWEQLRKGIVAAMDQVTATTTAPATATVDATQEAGFDLSKTSPLAYFSDESLKILTASIQDKSLSLTRQGASVQLAARLSPQDARELKMTIDTVRREAQKRLEKETNPENKKKLDAALRLAALVEIAEPKEGAFSASLDLVKLIDQITLLSEADHAWEAPETEKAEQYAATLQWIKARHVPVDEKMKLDQIMPLFKKGQLPANASAKPVTPGEGLFEPTATTNP